MSETPKLTEDSPGVIVRMVHLDNAQHGSLDGREVPNVVKFISLHDEAGEPFVTMTFRCSEIHTEHVARKR